MHEVLILKKILLCVFLFKNRVCKHTWLTLTAPWEPNCWQLPRVNCALFQHMVSTAVCTQQLFHLVFAYTGSTMCSVCARTAEGKLDILHWSTIRQEHYNILKADCKIHPKQLQIFHKQGRVKWRTKNSHHKLSAHLYCGSNSEHTELSDSNLGK